MRSKIKAGLRRMRNLFGTPAVILVYHRVATLEKDPQSLAVSPENFDSHIRVLKEKYNLLGIEQFADLTIQANGFAKNSVVISFDDGYADNLLEAAPILEKHNAQALFFVSTSLLDTPFEFWWDDLERIFLQSSPIPSKLEILLRKKAYTFSTVTPPEKQAAYQALHGLVKTCDISERAALLESVVRWSGLGAEGRSTHRVMTSAELRELSLSRSAVIGAHTHTHPRLSNCTHLEQYREISESKMKLESLLDRPVNYFSFPFGSKGDYNKSSIEICRQLGFKAVFANYHDQVHRWHSRFELPRILVRNWDEKTFQHQMKRFFSGK